MQKAKHILPAIMPWSFEHFTELVDLVAKHVEWAQIDIMDGRYTSDSKHLPKPSWPYANGAIGDFKKTSDLHSSLYAPENIKYEIDLMVTDPISIAKDFMRIGAERFIIHANSVENLEDTLNEMREMSEYEFSGNVFELGVALGVTPDFDLLAQVAPLVDFVQCMGIAVIGFQGQPFDERVLHNISKIKAQYGLCVSVDGAVTLKSAPKLISAGADRLVSGSGIYKAKNIAGQIETFEQLFIKE